MQHINIVLVFYEATELCRKQSSRDLKTCLSRNACFLLMHTVEVERGELQSRKKDFIVPQFQDRAAALHCDLYVLHFAQWLYICNRVLTSSGHSKVTGVTVAWNVAANTTKERQEWRRSPQNDMHIFSSKLDIFQPSFCLHHESKWISHVTQGILNIFNLPTVIRFQT
jgi:hypothetical protein